MECEEVASLVSGETEHCRELPSFLVSCLFPRMGDQSGDEEPGGVMNVCEGLGGEPNESSEHGQVGVEDLDPLQALRLGLELSILKCGERDLFCLSWLAKSAGTMRMVVFGGDELPGVKKNENSMSFVPVPTDGAKC
ncbi:unnamed protein product [Prunus armeniaca]